VQPLGNLSELIYSSTRFVVGFTFALHGAQKLFGVLDQDAVDLFSRMGVAGIVEFFGGALIALGLYTPWVAFIASGEMAFAYFTAHSPRGFWPVTNGGEAAVLYCFVFLYFASRGSGPVSLDRIIRRQRS
jgi:putative oxidoreductase